MAATQARPNFAEVLCQSNKILEVIRFFVMTVFLCHPVLYVTITKSQRHKKRMPIVIHYNPLRSFFYIRGLQTTAPRPNPACEVILQTTERGPNLIREYIL